MTQVIDGYASAGTAPGAERHFFDLLREFDTATVITRARVGSLHGRPMSIAEVGDDGTLWFITGIDSPKVLEIRDDSRVMVALQSARRFVNMNGHIELVSDRAKVEQIWKESYRIWFEGEGDPELVLLHFTPFDAEFWDESGIHGIKHAFEATKAYLQGQKVPGTEHDPDAHAKMQL